MPSIIPDYDYDIFISYRQKDNKYDGWVTEFVTNLKKELEATFKEDISIYFDANTTDGLLETHHVDKSLERKLKCLIFIPILSQTYCDPKSFAWRDEFCAFKRIATEDQYGLYVRLTNGNVESRILPIRIHELDAQDHQLLEDELGGVLRSLSFIYRTPGVNRPLRAHEDEPKENLNHIFYRDQINKVANTIKRTIAGIRMLGPSSEKISIEDIHKPPAKPRKTIKKRFVFASVFLISIMAAAFFYYYQTSTGIAEPDIDKSIAVLPFVDMSPEKDQEYFSDGLSEELLNMLTHIPDLKVISRTSVFSFKGKNEDVREIGKKLGVANILEGSVRKSGDQIRITAQLIHVKDGSHIWSQTYNRTLNDIFEVQDEIANAVVQQLRITLLGSEVIPKSKANSEAYNLYLQGKYFFARRSQENIDKAIEFFNQALAIEPDNAMVLAALSLVYTSQANNGLIDQMEGFEKARKSAERAIKIDPKLAAGHYALATILASHDWDWKEAKAEFQKALLFEPANIGAINGMANLSLTLGQFDEAIELYNKAIDLDPLRTVVKINLGMTLMHANRIDDAVVPIKSLLDMNSKFPTAHYRLGLCYLLQGNELDAIAEINKEAFEDWRLHGLILAHSGDTNIEKSDSLLQTFITNYSDVSAFQVAEIYGYRNEATLAFEWLEKAFELKDGGLSTLLGNPWLRSLENDPRYQPFLAKLGLHRD